MESSSQLDPITQAALRSLNEIVTPVPVSWIPQTWGWGVLAGALLVMLPLVGIRWILHYRANAYRRAALALLDGIGARASDHSGRDDTIQEVARILKRTAIAAWGREAVASLSGKNWSSFITGKGGPGEWRLLGKMVDDLEYRKPAPSDRPSVGPPDKFVREAREWIGRHHV